MFVLFVVLILPLVLAVFLGDVDDAAGQVSQQILDREGGFTELLDGTDVHVHRSVL